MTHTVEWEIQSVSGRLPDNPGVLKKLNRDHFRVPFIVLILYQLKESLTLTLTNDLH